MESLSPNGNTFTDLVFEIVRLNRLLLEAGVQLTQPAGLTSARWQVLGVVEHGPDPVAHVARIMGLTRQSVQQTADGLAADGLIAYSENPHHRRAKLMTITPKGRQALDDVLPRHAVWANQLGGQHTPEELQTALEVLHRIRTSLEHDSTSAENG
jgi:DNA-binding MarR family transcriptional regulator